MSRVLEAMDKTCLIELVTEVPPASNQLETKSTTTEISSQNFGGEVGDKFNFAGKYSTVLTSSKV
jgi:hypothetical protein